MSPLFEPGVGVLDDHAWLRQGLVERFLDVGELGSRPVLVGQVNAEPNYQLTPPRPVRKTNRATK